MGRRFNTLVLGLLTTLAVSACGSQERHMNVAAPLPPLKQSEFGAPEMQQIQPSNGLALTASAAPQKASCSFSSFHRKHTIGYELDESRHIALRVSPSFDVFDPSDFETKVSLRFTKALSGPANKRPKCKYGSGFYGLLPYARNEGINVRGLFEGQSIKSFVEEKLETREQRRQEREAEMAI